MPAQKHPLVLTAAERQQLEVVCRSGRRTPREKTRARILLLTDTNRPEGALTDRQIAQNVGCALPTVAKLRTRAAQRGALKAIAHKDQSPRKARALDGAQEAHLVTLCCSAPPEGRKRWTLKLLQGRLIELEVVESIACETIRRTLKKTN